MNCSQVRGEKQEGERGVGDGSAWSKTQRIVLFSGRNASRTNWLQSRSLLRVPSTLLFLGSGMLRGHGESSLLICGASWTVSRVMCRDFGGWEAKRSKRNKEEAVFRT